MTRLQKVFEVPKQCISRNPSADEPCVSAPSKEKTFNSISNRHKRTHRTLA